MQFVNFSVRQNFKSLSPAELERLKVQGVRVTESGDGCSPIGRGSEPCRRLEGGMLPETGDTAGKRPVIWSYLMFLQVNNGRNGGRRRLPPPI